jgi:hypothetical protein
MIRFERTQNLEIKNIISNMGMCLTLLNLH